MEQKDFIATMKRRTAVTAVGPSALRGQGKGVLGAAQTFLSKMDLSRVSMMNREQFYHWLDKQTYLLVKQLPARGAPWGTARKAINLFLRDILYNQYLSRAFGMKNIEHWLEVPLDSAVASGLKHEAGRDGLPAWPGLKNLKKDISQDFQNFALHIAEENGIARIHLDVYLWLENR
ncbi:MAG: hypothetical protein A2169_04735 [Deltaproteobacteria bacterium RBG_13_47_9]|nr:MAG: hypothetical protein A2169_04735 [Deltaproteobacteria bacterium RBG_13_47_9]